MGCFRRFRIAWLALWLPSVSVHGQVNTDPTDNSLGPDVIVGDLQGVYHWGSGAGGTIHAYSVGTTSCNIGDRPLLWHNTDNQHPVIAQNMYRLKDGRFEQIGQSWAKWGFLSTNESFCATCINPGTGSLLGVNCSDPYGATLNGSQSSLGPRSSINPFTGAFPQNHTTPGSGTINGRLQVHTTDLDPAQNPGAQYFVEGHYVTPDDAAAGNLYNNASYRQVWVSASYSVSFNSPQGGTSTTVREQSAIYAWKAADALVTIAPVDVPGDGRLFVGARATSLGSGQWRYEFAIHNLNSNRAIGSIFFPLPAGTAVTNLGFHDVDYHSGEPYSGTDWPGTATGAGVGWSTSNYTADPNANALRWGTLYNFRFDANVGPLAVTEADLGLFLPGTPTSITVPLAITPTVCRGDCDCNGLIGFSDIDYFVAAIPDNQTAWAALYAAAHGGQQPPCPFANCDVTGDGHVDFGDIDPFVALIPSACP